MPKKKMATPADYIRKMTPEETEVYRIAVTYEQEFRRIFADRLDAQTLRKNIIPRTGNPLKSSIFRYMWKLRRETRGLLEIDEYRFYIQSNLEILKLKNAFVEPNVVCGDKAWIRYKVWKRLIDKKCEEIAQQVSVEAVAPKHYHELDRTKKFLYERCDGEPTSQKLKTFLDSNIFRFWIMQGKVSQFYAAHSPFLAKNCDVTALCESCGFSPNLIRERTDPKFLAYIESEFKYESEF